MAAVSNHWGLSFLTCVFQVCLELSLSMFLLYFLRSSENQTYTLLDDLTQNYMHMKTGFEGSKSLFQIANTIYVSTPCCMLPCALQGKCDIQGILYASGIPISWEAYKENRGREIVWQRGSSQSQNLHLMTLPLKSFVSFPYIRPAWGIRASQWVLDRGPLFEWTDYKKCTRLGGYSLSPFICQLLYRLYRAA